MVIKAVFCDWLDTSAHFAPPRSTMLERASVKASEAVHVGNQYNLDVMDASSVGIKPILIDRYDLSLDVSDCPQMRNLTELVSHLWEFNLFG